LVHANMELANTSISLYHTTNQVFPMVGGGSRALYQGMAPIDVHDDNPYCSPLLKYVSKPYKDSHFYQLENAESCFREHYVQIHSCISHARRPLEAPAKTTTTLTQTINYVNRSPHPAWRFYIDYNYAVNISRSLIEPGLG